LICIERHQFPHCRVGLCYYRCSLEGPWRVRQVWARILCSPIRGVHRRLWSR
jgi:hypothetical protein